MNIIFLPKASVVLTLALCFTLSLQGQNVFSVLYDSGAAVFCEVGLQTGALDVINATEGIVPFVYPLGGTVINPYAKRFYFPGNDSNNTYGYFTVDITSGALVQNSTVSSFQSIQTPQFYPADSNVYGISLIQLNQGNQFARIDYQTGMQDPLQHFPEMEYHRAEALNKNSGEYVVVGHRYSEPIDQDWVYSIHISDSTQTTSVVYASDSGWTIIDLAFHEDLDKFFGMEQKVITSPDSVVFRLVELDHNTGVTTAISEYHHLKYQAIVQSVLLAAGDEYLFVGSYKTDNSAVQRLFAVDVSSGEIKRDPLLDYPIRTLTYLDTELAGIAEERGATTCRFFRILQPPY